MRVGAVSMKESTELGAITRVGYPHNKRPNGEVSGGACLTAAGAQILKTGAAASSRC